MIEVVKSGLYSSIQDSGRYGFRDIGVPISGAMDLEAYNLANFLLKNDINASVIEMTMTGVLLKFKCSTQIVITGADMSPKLNSVLIENNKVVQVDKNDSLEFGKLKSGLHCYVGVKGGFISDVVMGSRSFYGSITASPILNNGDILNIKPFKALNGLSVNYSKLKIRDYSDNVIKVFKGPEFHYLSDTEKTVLLSTNFKVSGLCNRMAYQLQSLFKNNLDGILTSPVIPGTVQLTPSGKLIILMRDCQTTGGYPRVLQLSETSINLLSHKREREDIRFELISF